MKVALAYFSVVAIWSTTPLAIKWSNSSLSFTAAVASRVVFALVVCLAILAMLRRPLVEKRSDWLAFFAGLVGAFPNVLLIYWAAQYIPSGLMAVVFGLYPFMVGFFSLIIARDNIFNLRRVLALAIALCGLAVINANQIQLGGNAVYGLFGMAIATVFFGLSSVWVKHIGCEIDPLRQSTGVLLLSAPLLIICWYVSDGTIPTNIDRKSALSVLYLALCGSVLGGMLFFYVLKYCRVSSVGLITFLTPIAGLTIGVAFGGETISFSAMLGCVLVIFALALYQDVFRLADRAFSRWKQATFYPTESVNAINRQRCDRGVNSK